MTGYLSRQATLYFTPEWLCIVCLRYDGTDEIDCCRESVSSLEIVPDQNDATVQVYSVSIESCYIIRLLLFTTRMFILYRGAELVKVWSR